MAKQRTFFRSLRGKVSLQMLIVSLVPILIVGGLVYNSMSSAEQSASDSLSESRAALEQDTIGANKAAQAWGLSVDMEKWIAERVGEVKSWARNRSIVEVAKSGEDTDRVAWSFLAREVAGFAFYDEAHVTDPSGGTLITTSFSAAYDEPANSSWQQAWDNGFYVSEVYLPDKGIKPPYLIDIAVRIEDYSGDDAFGVVVASVVVHPQGLNQEFTSKVRDSKILVWSRTGKLIADSGDVDRYLSGEWTWTEAEQNVVDMITNDTEVVDGNYVITDDFVAGYARAANKSASIQFPDFDGLGWMIMVEQPEREAFAALDSLEDLENDLEDSTSNMVFTLLVVLAAVFVVVMGGAFYMSRSITRPIAQLNDAAEKVSMGDLDVTVDVKSDDEIGDLAESFGRMVTAVRFLSEDD
ncbi:MAG: HAMP domain-containing protein [Chloroflexi bacterium]|nr:HAMP domain-containing protein [Chloroflexota bacterium]